MTTYALNKSAKICAIKDPLRDGSRCEIKERYACTCIICKHTPGVLEHLTNFV